MIQIKMPEDVGNKPIVFLDGKKLTEDEASIYTFNDKVFITIYSYELTQRVIMHSFDKFPNELFELDLSFKLDFIDLIQKISIQRKLNGNSNFSLSYQYTFEWEKWKENYSIEEFEDAMKTITSHYTDSGLYWIQEDEDFITNGCHILCDNIEQDKKIKDVIERYTPYIKEITDKVNSLLINSTEENSLVNIFDFPEHIKTACEQYLIYFVDFLKEIGIDASIDMEHEASKLLFSVTPNSNGEGLEQIKKALDIYLQLPVVIDSKNISYLNNEPKVQQLVANIQHLNSQLLLSNAMVQTQKLTIDNQQVVISQQRKIIDANILQQSYTAVTNVKEDNKEKLLGGAVSLTKVKGTGFEIDLPNIYRWIKNKINKE